MVVFHRWWCFTDEKKSCMRTETQQCKWVIATLVALNSEQTLLIGKTDKQCGMSVTGWPLHILTKKWHRTQMPFRAFLSLEQSMSKQPAVCLLGIIPSSSHKAWLDGCHNGGLFWYSGLRKVPSEAVWPGKPALFEIWCNQSSWAFLLHLMLRIWVIASYCLWRLLRAPLLGPKGQAPAGGSDAAVLECCADGYLLNQTSKKLTKYGPATLMPTL